MLSSYLAIQNAILARNTAVRQMMNLSNISFGNSLPLRPAFGQYDQTELQNKANETKVSVLNKFIDAINKKLSKDIDRSVPKYCGIDYKA